MYIEKKTRKLHAHGDPYGLSWNEMVVWLLHHGGELGLCYGLSGLALHTLALYTS